VRLGRALTGRNTACGSVYAGVHARCLGCSVRRAAMTEAAAPTNADPTATAAPSPAAPSAAAEAREDTMPRGIPYIVANEFAERFCYYGINAILTVYMTKFLRMGDADATTYHSLFKSGAYFFPLLGALISDVFWGKYRTIMTFSLVYATGCAVVSLVPGQWGLFSGLFLVAFGTGGIKPCVSTNVGDQFTSRNQHLIERAFSYFYLAINAGSTISILLCPVLLDPFDKDAKPQWFAKYLTEHGLYGPKLAFGLPAAAMLLATLAFWLGRKQFAVIPPAGRAWLEEAGMIWLWRRTARRLLVKLGMVRQPGEEAPASSAGLRVIGSLSILFYVFVAVFWSLWDQCNGQTWTLQAESSLMDKNVAFGFTLLPAQIQSVNGLFILALVPVFTFGIYPLVNKFTKTTPLRRIGAGLFVSAGSFLIVAWIEGRIMAGQTVSVWWQFVAYIVLTAGEVLVSITALEFSYKQAPPRMKSFIMAMFLFSTSVGNGITALVNHEMKRPLEVVSAQVGDETWVTLGDVSGIVVGQKIDLDGKSGVIIVKDLKPGEEAPPLKGTFLVAATDVDGRRVRLMDVVDRKPLVTRGTFRAEETRASTYRLVGPQYFEFFAALMFVVALLFIPFATSYKGRTYVRDEPQEAAA
jgi:POT family proton-dependent oligopeptide transporter